MDLWDREAVELLGPAFFEFGPDGRGSFRFIPVEGWMDGREACHDGRPAVEFTWRGSDALLWRAQRGRATQIVVLSRLRRPDGGSAGGSDVGAFLCRCAPRSGARHGRCTVGRRGA